MIKIAGFCFRVTGIEASSYYEQREHFFVKKVHSKVADSLTMVPAIEIDLYLWECAIALFSLVLSPASYTKEPKRSHARSVSGNRHTVLGSSYGSCSGL